MAKAQRVAAMSAMWAVAEGGPSLVRLVHSFGRTETKKVRGTGGSPRRVFVLGWGDCPRVIGVGEQADVAGRGDLTGERRR